MTAGVMDAQWADGKSPVSALGPADLHANPLVDEQNGER